MKGSSRHERELEHAPAQRVPPARRASHTRGPCARIFGWLVGPAADGRVLARVMLLAQMACGECACRGMHLSPAAVLHRSCISRLAASLLAAVRGRQQRTNARSMRVSTQQCIHGDL